MENQQLIQILQQYLYLPLTVSVIGVILAAFLSYLSTFFLSKHNYNEEKKVKTVDLIEKYIIELNKLKLVFNKLRDEVEDLSYFSFKTLDLGTSIGWRLKNFNDSITLLKDTIRLKVLDIVDKSTSLVDEIYGLEKNPVNEYAELKNSKIQASKEYRDLTLKLLDVGVYVKPIGDKFECRYIDTSKEDKNLQNDIKLQIYESVRLDLLKNRHEGENKLDIVNAETSKKRNFFLIKLMDMETKIQELVNILDNFKNTNL